MWIFIFLGSTMDTIWQSQYFSLWCSRTSLCNWLFQIWHNVFKRHGGRLTAENENLRLLDNRDHPVTQAFNNLVD
jgi:hypothetical protein